MMQEGSVKQRAIEQHSSREASWTPMRRQAFLPGAASVPVRVRVWRPVAPPVAIGAKDRTSLVTLSWEGGSGVIRSAGDTGAIRRYAIGNGERLLTAGQEPR